VPAPQASLIKEFAMKIQNLCLISTVALALASPALAQSTDTTYCKALASSYQEYVAGGSGRHGGVDQNASITIAIDKCNGGDASGIPVLEQALKNAKVPLPHRS
jgi:hypothetical protein